MHSLSREVDEDVDERYEQYTSSFFGLSTLGDELILIFLVFSVVFFVCCCICFYHWHKIKKVLCANGGHGDNSGTGHSSSGGSRRGHRTDVESRPGRLHMHYDDVGYTSCHPANADNDADAESGLAAMAASVRPQQPEVYDDPPPTYEEAEEMAKSAARAAATEAAAAAATQTSAAADSAADAVPKTDTATEV